MTTTADFSYTVTNNWGTGFVTEWTYTPTTTANDWRVTIEFDGEIDQIWNATLISSNGTQHVLAPVAWNEDVAAGQSVGFGFRAAGTDTTIETVAVTTGGTTPVDPPPVDETVAFTVEATTTEEGDPGGAASGPFSTSGNAIVDGAGNPVSFAGVSWFGFETDIAVAHGLWTRNWQDMVDQIADLGFNLVRLPFSAAAVNGEVAPGGIDFGLNPDLEGLSSIEIMDKIIAYGAEQGLTFLLDYHRANPGGGPNESGLWTQGDFSEDDWVLMWENLAARYGDNPAIIGADIVNEPHSATWDQFATAAERVGNAIHQDAPDWLIVVEGVATYEGDSYWWGGNLQGVRDRPVVLNQVDKVVYSPHDYPASVFDQPWFNDGTDLIEKFRENWGYIHEEGIAPVLIGEMGSRLQTDKDRAWADAIVDYIEGDYDRNGTKDPEASDARPGFIWWSFNPNSSDTGGILQDDWQTPDPVKLAQIQGLIDTATPFDGAVTAFITISLDEAASGVVTIDYETEDGSATAGEDYVATSGTLTFQPGEREKSVALTLLPDDVDEGDETFTLVLTQNGEVTRVDQVIADDDDGAGTPLPSVSVADTTVDESAGEVFVTLTLSEAAATPVSVDVASQNGTATAGSDYGALTTTATFAAGTTTATVRIALIDDAAPEGTEQFDVVLSSPNGATIGDGRGTVTIIDGDVAPPADPVVSIAGVTASEADGVANLTLTLSEASAAPVTLTLSPTDGTAVAGADFAGGPSTVVIPAGAVTANVAIPLVDDAEEEAQETFTVAITAADGATIGTGSATVTVVDDDAPPPTDA
ncbi:MAG: Calx-beta domain-containing protein, partial [Pseudomonadota bacterium]